MNIRKKRITNFLFNEKYFRNFYIMCLFLSSLCYVEHFFQFLTGIGMFWAYLLLTNRFDHYNKNVASIRYSRLLIAFIGCTLITIMNHRYDNFGTNLFLLYHVTICFFLFYGIHTSTNKEEIKKELFSLFKTIFITTTIFAILGIMVFLFFTRIKSNGYVIGLNGRRFTGLYTHPNIAAFISVVGIVSGHLIYKKVSLPKWFFTLSIIFNMLTILLSDSNASLLFLLIYGALLMYFSMIHKYNKIKLKQLVLLAYVFLITGISSLVVRNVTQQGMSFINSSLHPVIQEDIKVKQNPTTTVEIGRDERTDLSSGRVDSLLKSFSLLEKFPLMGIGKSNIVDYGDRYLDEGFQYFDLHNGYLTILVSGGIIGFSIFFFFMLMLGKDIIRGTISSIRSNSDDNTLTLFTSSIGAYLVYALFERAMLLDVTFMVLIFWLLLGYATALVTTKEKELSEETELTIPTLKPNFYTIK